MPTTSSPYRQHLTTTSPNLSSRSKKYVEVEIKVINLRTQILKKSLLVIIGHLRFQIGATKRFLLGTGDRDLKDSNINRYAQPPDLWSHSLIH